MRRLLMSASLGVLAILLLVAPVAAARTWCMRDPIVTLNGKPVQIWVGLDVSHIPAVNGPVEVKIYHPAEVSGELIFLDMGFNGYGESLKFSPMTDLKQYKDGSFEIIVTVTVPVDKDVLVKRGIKSKTIPLRIEVETNGELISYTTEAGTTAWDVINGDESVVEQTNDGAKISVRVN